MPTLKSHGAAPARIAGLAGGPDAQAMEAAAAVNLTAAAASMAVRTANRWKVISGLAIPQCAE